MRDEQQIGRVLVRQLPAVRGYDALVGVRAMLNRIDAKAINDILMKATTEELDSLFEHISYGCTVDGEPLVGNEDAAFDSPFDFYGYLNQAVVFNFKTLWEADAVTLDHTSEITPQETKLTPPFFMGVLSEGKMSLEDLETKYTVLDVARYNELMVVQANNEHKMRKKAEGDSGSAPPGTIAHAMGQRGV